MGRRDALYRRLFTHHQLLRDLLACVLDAGWLRDLDWPNLQAVDPNYVGDRLQERVGDGAWRIPYRSGEGQGLYLLLMLEHQSRPDTYMALRMATYAGLRFVVQTGTQPRHCANIGIATHFDAGDEGTRS